MAARLCVYLSRTNMSAPIPDTIDEERKKQRTHIRVISRTPKLTPTATPDGNNFKLQDYCCTAVVDPKLLHVLLSVVL